MEKNNSLSVMETVTSNPISELHSSQLNEPINKSRRNFSILFGLTMLASPMIACGLGDTGVTIPEKCAEKAEAKELRAIRAYISNFISKGFSPEEVQRGVNQTCYEIEQRP